MENYDEYELLRNIHSKNNGKVRITNEVVQFTQMNSEPINPVQMELIEYTNQLGDSFMLTDIGQNQLFTLLLKVLNAKKIIDIGVYTGLSSLTFALSFKNNNIDNGIVYALDVTNKYEKSCHQYWSKAGVDNNIKLIIQDATVSLNQLIESGQEGTFDFIFIDANKESYDTYYELSLKLIKSGGIIAFDNVLFFGSTVHGSDLDDNMVKLLTLPYFDNLVTQLKKLNDKISKDNRVIKTMLPLSDGITLITKK